MKKIRIISAALFFASVIVSCDKDYNNDDNNYTPPVNANVFTAGGDSAGIAAKLTEFRNTLGATLNTAPGATGGRREINWDAVPASFTNNNNFPHDFFGQTDAALPNGRKRGFIIENTAVPFRVDSTNFVDVASSYNAQFRDFSPKKLFMSMGGNETIAVFRVPGTATEAFVKGFGVVFADVDNAGSTTIEFFNGAKSLGVYKAPVSGQSTKGFSLLGVYFPDEKITKVKIKSGQATLSGANLDITTAGGTQDIVVMDDFLYDEPKSIQ